MERKLIDLCRIAEGRIIGDPEYVINGLAPLDKAQPHQLSFLTNPKYRNQALATQAGAVILQEEMPGAPFHQIACKNPYLALARIMQLFFPPDLPPHGIHPSSSVGRDCCIDPSARITSGVSLGDRVTIGENTALFPGVVIGNDSVIGSHCIIYPNVVVYDRVRIGSNVIIHGSAVIGSDGFGYARDGARYVKIPQIGTVLIEDDVEIGAGTTIDRGSLNDTVIHRGVKLDNLIQIAHNVTIGSDTAIAAQTGVSGSTRIGDRVTIGGQVGIIGHARIGNDVILTAKSGIISDVPEKIMVSGFPHQIHRKWLKNQSMLTHADEWRCRIEDLQDKICFLEEEISRLKARIDRE